jgi:hypothetical protein
VNVVTNYLNNLKLFVFFFACRHSNIKPNRKSPREILHDVLDKWEEGLGEKPFISGNEQPNLADIVNYSK